MIEKYGTVKMSCCVLASTQSGSLIVVDCGTIADVKLEVSQGDIYLVHGGNFARIQASVCAIGDVNQVSAAVNNSDFHSRSKRTGVSNELCCACVTVRSYGVRHAREFMALFVGFK